MSTPSKLQFNARTHSYWVDGVRWAGASSWGKLIEDTTTLERWGLRMCLLGAALEPALLDEAIAAQDDRRALDDITWRARQRAGADVAARKGTAHHRLTELMDLGRLGTLSPSAQRVVDRWRAVLDAAGVEVLPEYVERVALNGTLQCCATFDRIVRYQGRLVVADLKTGSNAVEYPHSMAVQLAVIANAQLLAVDGVTKGDTTTYERFVEMPGVDQEVGLIVAMPADGEHAEVHEVDLVAGWEAAQLAHQARRWGRRKDLTRKVADTAALPEPEPVVPIPDDPFDGLNGEPLIDIRWSNLLGRYDRLKTMTGGVEALARRWPATVATIGRDRDQRPDAEQDEIEAAIEAAEREVGAPFDPAPSAPAVADDEPPKEPRFSAQPCPEGRTLSGDEINAVRLYVADLPGDVRARAASWQPDAMRAGVGYLFSERQTERRRQLMRAGVALASLGGSDDDARVLLGVVLGDELQPSTPVGVALGALTIAEAQRLIDLCAAVDGGGCALQYDLDGRLTVAGDVAVYGPAAAA